MELLPYLPIDPSTLSLSVLDVSSLSLSDGMEFLRPDLSSSGAFFGASHKRCWHNIYVNQIFSVLPPHHEWNRNHTALFLFLQLSQYHNTAKDLFLEQIEVRDWFLHGINRIMPLLYPTEADLHLRTRKQRRLWHLFMHG